VTFWLGIINLPSFTWIQIDCEDVLTRKQWRSQPRNLGHGPFAPPVYAYARNNNNFCFAKCKNNLIRNILPMLSILCIRKICCGMHPMDAYAISYIFYVSSFDSWSATFCGKLVWITPRIFVLFSEKRRNAKVKLRIRRKEEHKISRAQTVANDLPSKVSNVQQGQKTKGRKRSKRVISTEEWINRLFHGVPTDGRKCSTRNAANKNSGSNRQGLHSRRRDSEHAWKTRHDWEDFLSRQDDATVNETATVISGDRKRKYDCVVQYVAINTIRCYSAHSARANTSAKHKGNGRRCFVVRHLRVRNWSCRRQINKTSSEIVKFVRSPFSSGDSQSICHIFNGVSYVSTKEGSRHKPRYALVKPLYALISLLPQYGGWTFDKTKRSNWIWNFYNGFCCLDR